MEQTLIPANLLEAGRCSSTTSNSSEEEDTTYRTKSQKLLELDLISMHQQSEVLPHQTSFVVPSKESKKSPSKRYHGEIQKKHRTQKALVELQPISKAFCFGWSSTLQGTPWEDALSHGSTQTGKRSIKTGKPDQKTFKEMENMAFWKQFFG